MADEKNENVFVDGLYAYKPHEKAPDFVKLDLVAYVKDICPFFQENEDEEGKVKFQLRKSQGGKYYLALNTWKKEETQEEPPSEVNPSEIV